MAVPARGVAVGEDVVGGGAGLGDAEGGFEDVASCVILEEGVRRLILDTDEAAVRGARGPAGGRRCAGEAVVFVKDFDAARGDGRRRGGWDAVGSL